MSATIQFPYTTPANYTYDSSLIEVSGGVAKLKDLRPTDATFSCNYNTKDGDWGDGVLTGTLIGGASVAGGVLDLSGGTNSGCSYSAVDNADFTQVGAIRMSVKFKYAGLPPSTHRILAMGNAASDANKITITHASNGNFLAYVYNSSGGIIAAMVAYHSAILNSVVELEVNTDSTTGEHRFFMDGTQVGTTATGTGTRAAAETVYIGTNRAGNGDSDIEVSYFQVFTSIQHTADYTPVGQLSDTLYSLTDPIISVNSSFKSTEIEAFVETGSVKSGSDEIKHIVTVGSTDRWINAGTGADSNGTYAESSTAAEMNTDATELMNARANALLKTFLHSDDGSTTPELSLVEISYNSTLPDPTLPTMGDLEGFIFKITGPKASLDIKIRPYVSGNANDGVFQIYEYETVGTTNADGWFEGTVYLNAVSKFYDVKIGKQAYKIDISGETGTIDISTLSLDLIPEE